MSLLYSFKEVFKGKFPVPLKLWAILEDFSDQLDKKSEPKAILKKDVKLNKTQLKKAFGNPKDFDSVGVILNSEGGYLVVSDRDKHFYIATLDEV